MRAPRRSAGSIPKVVAGLVRKRSLSEFPRPLWDGQLGYVKDGSGPVYDVQATPTCRSTRPDRADRQEVAS